MTQAATTTPQAATTTYEVSSELQKILAAHDRRKDVQGSDDLKRLLQGELLFNKLTPSVLSTKGRIEQAILLAEGIEYLKSILTDDIMRRYFMPLQNNPRGFLTDKKDGYSIEVVRECLIDAFTRGLGPTGNQFNIIQGRMYVTRNGMSFLLTQVAGFENLIIDPSVPQKYGERGVVISYKTKWTLHGKAFTMDREIPVKVNEGQGADALLGKGDRKIKAAIYERITGTVFSEEGEVDDPETAAKTREQEAREAIDKRRAETTPSTKVADAPTSAPASATENGAGENKQEPVKKEETPPAGEAGNAPTKTEAKSEAKKEAPLWLQ